MTAKELPFEYVENKIIGIWECGGATTKKGAAVIICDERGLPLVPILIRNRGELSNSNHALFALPEFCYAINCKNTGNEYEIKIWQIQKKLDDIRILCVGIGKYNQWFNTEPLLIDKLSKAILAAKNKSCKFHCRFPLFVSHCS